MEAESPIGARIRELREGRQNQADFAYALGTSLSSIRRYETGERLPDAEFLLAAREKLGINPTWILTGEGPKRLAAIGEVLSLAAEAHAQLTEFVTSGEAQKVRVAVAGKDYFVNPNDYRFVPVLNVRLSGGPGLANLFENVAAFNAYRKSWLADWGLIDAILSEAGVTGRSMEPELRDGDTVLVNHSAEFVGGDIYALRQGEDLLVKYLQKLPGDRIQVISENTAAFPSYVIEPADFESGECEIIGRVELQTRHRGRRTIDSRLVDH